MINYRNLKVGDVLPPEAQLRVEAPRPGRTLTADQRPEDGGLDWYLLRTATQREMDAEAHLVEAGFVVYLPRLARWRRICSKKVRIERPLVPGLMFGALAKDGAPAVFSQVEAVSGVVRLSPDRAKPTAPFSEIWTMLQLERMGTFDATRAKPLEKGEQVMILEGQFAGMVAEFVKLRGRGVRANVLISILGRRQKLDLAVDVLERVA